MLCQACLCPCTWGASPIGEPVFVQVLHDVGATPLGEPVFVVQHDVGATPIGEPVFVVHGVLSLNLDTLA